MFILEITTLGLALAAGISALAGLIGGVATNKSNERSVEETNAANANLWREQTAYNDPSNVMQRFKKAGLNPNLISGNSLAGTASQAPQMIPSQNQNPVNLDPLTAAQIANIDADTQLKQQQITESQSIIKIHQDQLDIAGEQLKLSQRLTDKQIELLQAQIDYYKPMTKNLEAQTDEIVQRAKGLKIENIFNQQTFGTRLAKFASEAGIAEETYKSLIQQNFWNPKLFASTLALNASTTRVNNANAFAQEFEDKLLKINQKSIINTSQLIAGAEENKAQRDNNLSQGFLGDFIYSIEKGMDIIGKVSGAGSGFGKSALKIGSALLPK